MNIEKIAIVSNEKILYINTYDIVYIQSEGLAIAITLLDGTKHIVYKQLTKLQSLLPEFFVRVTQCVLIIKIYLNSIEKKDKVIRMQGNIEIKYTMTIGKLLDRIGEISAEASNLSDFSEQDGKELFLKSF